MKTRTITAKYLLAQVGYYLIMPQLNKRIILRKKSNELQIVKEEQNHKLSNHSIDSHFKLDPNLLKKRAI